MTAVTRKPSSGSMSVALLASVTPHLLDLQADLLAQGVDLGLQIADARLGLANSGVGVPTLIEKPGQRDAGLRVPVQAIDGVAALREPGECGDGGAVLAVDGAESEMLRAHLIGERRQLRARLDRLGEQLVEGRVKARSEEHTSELQSPDHLVCRLLLEKKKHHKDYAH